MVSGAWDTTVRIWDPATGAQVGEALRGHENWVNSVALGEIDRAARVVSGSDDNTVRIWHPATGFPPVSTLGSVRAVALGAERDIYFATGAAVCRVTVRNHRPGHGWA